MTIRTKKEFNGKPVLDLTGPDGNAFALIAYAKGYAKQLNMMDEWPALQKEMMNGDYENLVQTFDKTFGDFVILER